MKKIISIIQISFALTLSLPVTGQGNNDIQFQDASNKIFHFSYEGAKEQIKKNLRSLDEVKDTVYSSIYISPCNYDFFSNKYVANCGPHLYEIDYENSRLKFGGRYIKGPIYIENTTSLEVIQLKYLNCQKANISVPQDADLWTNDFTADTAEIQVYNNSKLNISGNFKYMNVSADDSLTNIELKEIKIGKLCFNSNINVMGNGNVPDTIIFSDKQISPIDLSKFNLGGNLKHYIYTKNVNGWNFNYKHFNILTYHRNNDTFSLKKDQIHKLYSDILEVQKIHGYEGGYEKAYKEFEELKYHEKGKWGYILNWVDKYWWDYGYGRHLIFRNSLVLLLIAFIGNLFFFNFLLTNTYNIERVNECCIFR